MGVTIGRYAPVGHYGFNPPPRHALARPLDAQSELVVLECATPAASNNPKLAQQLASEAEQLARLKAPGVVGLRAAFVARVGQDQGLFFAHEYSPGHTLEALQKASLQRREPISERVAVGILVDVLRALAAAHEATHEGVRLAVIHRHLSPRHIIVGADGVSRVMGFTEGIRRRWSTTEFQQEILADLSYLAPEQARGQVPTSMVDQYAAAAILWGLLAGRPLVRATTMLDGLNQVLFNRLGPLNKAKPGGSPLESLLHLALAKQPRERPAGAILLAERLAASVPPASQGEIATWAQALGADPFPGNEIYELPPEEPAPPPPIVSPPHVSAPYRIVHPSEPPPAPPPRPASQTRNKPAPEGPPTSQTRIPVATTPPPPEARPARATLPPVAPLPAETPEESLLDTFLRKIRSLRE